MNLKSQITNLLQTISGEKFNICGEVYEILKTADENQSGELLQFFLETSEEIKSSEEREARHFLTEGEVLDYTKLYGKIVDGLLENLLLQKPCKSVFYKTLWGKLTLDGLFENDKLQIFALYYIWIDVRIPYFELPETICFKEEDYRQIIERLKSKIQEARFILSSDFEQWAQVSYLLLKLMDEIDSEEEKTVFLSCVMQMRDKMLLRTITENAKESEE